MGRMHEPTVHYRSICVHIGMSFQICAITSLDSIILKVSVFSHNVVLPEYCGDSPMDLRLNQGFMKIKKSLPDRPRREDGGAKETCILEMRSIDLPRKEKKKKNRRTFVCLARAGN